MSAKPDFATMTSSDLRTYVLDHRQDQDALQAYLDKRRDEGKGSKTYGADDDVSTAIDEYLAKMRSN
jgi:hypothetical protein